MSWDSFIYFAVVSLLLWAGGAFFAWKDKARWAIGLTLLGLCVFFVFILSMWIGLERPPMRTLGETRLWYALFLPLAGLFVYGRWRYKWILSFAAVMATVFVCINLFKPEIHTKTLMPALQSPWFAPHVIVYMFAYAMLGASFLMALWMLKPRKDSQDHFEGLDNLVNIGLAFMTFGMLFGALWAKEAWGHYWSWDPKETWAAATWFGYLCYIHYRRYPRHRPRVALWMLIVCFLLLQVCWWGINYLPSAQGVSVHTYGS
ncbi:MAG: cytochrome c biogenesis protein CcsA [Prevotella sp.]|nr:cytochrome c biogenesis protein CcsA [Prevotella sp.]